MTDRYLYSVTGNVANTGQTNWANAKATLADVVSVSAAGDTVWVAGGHVESNASSQTISSVGTQSQPVRLICASDSAAPPTAEATTAVVAGATSNYALTINGNLYASGITFSPGSTGAALMNINTGDEDVQVYENCRFVQVTTQSTSRVNFGLMNTSNSAYTLLKNTWFKFAGTAQNLCIWHKFRAVGGGIEAGSAQITTLVDGVGAASVDATFESFDLSVLSTTFNIAGSATTQSGRIILSDCKFPANWEGNLMTTGYAGLRVEVYNAMLGTVKLPIAVQDAYGSCWAVSTTYRTGGAVEEATPMALRMVSAASAAAYPSVSFEGPTLGAYIGSSGTPVTRYLEIVHDSQGTGAGAALTDAEFGVRLTYPGGMTEVIKANFFAAPTALPSSSATWTTPGMVTPVKQRLALTFTPSVKGPVSVTPLLFVSGKTVYVCPELEA